MQERRAAHWRNNWFVKIFIGTKRWAHEGREFLHMGKHLQQAFEVRNNYFVLES
jgi:hypothetical protein